MAIDYIPQYIGIYRSGQNLTTKEGFAVRFNSFKRWQLATTGEDAHGILSSPAPMSGQVAKVCVYGIHKAVAGGPFESGRPLSVDADGRLIESNGGAIIAYSVGSATQVGDIVEVFVGARGGVNVILDAESDPIGPGETGLVDSVNTEIIRAATWLVTIQDDPLTGTEYFQVNANHVGTDVNHQVFGWVKTGSPISRSVLVSLDTLNNKMELRVTNSGITPILVKALQIRTVAV